MSNEEQKLYPIKSTKGGKREGAGRPLGSKSLKPKWKSMEEMSVKYLMLCIKTLFIILDKTYVV